MARDRDAPITVPAGLTGPLLHRRTLLTRAACEVRSELPKALASSIPPDRWHLRMSGDLSERRRQKDDVAWRMGQCITQRLMDPQTAICLTSKTLAVRVKTL